MSAITSAALWLCGVIYGSSPSLPEKAVVLTTPVLSDRQPQMKSGFVVRELPSEKWVKAVEFQQQSERPSYRIGGLATRLAEGLVEKIFETEDCYYFLQEVGFLYRVSKDFEVIDRVDLESPADDMALTSEGVVVKLPAVQELLLLDLMSLKALARVKVPGVRSVDAHEDSVWVLLGMWGGPGVFLNIRSKELRRFDAGSEAGEGDFPPGFLWSKSSRWAVAIDESRFVVIGGDRLYRFELTASGVVGEEMTVGGGNLTAESNLFGSSDGEIVAVVRGQSRIMALSSVDMPRLLWSRRGARRNVAVAGSGYSVVVGPAKGVRGSFVLYDESGELVGGFSVPGCLTSERAILVPSGLFLMCRTAMFFVGSGWLQRRIERRR